MHTWKRWIHYFFNWIRIRNDCIIYLDVLDIEGTEGRMAGRVEVDERG